MLECPPLQPSSAGMLTHIKDVHVLKLLLLPVQPGGLDDLSDIHFIDWYILYSHVGINNTVKYRDVEWKWWDKRTPCYWLDCLS